MYIFTRNQTKYTYEPHRAKASNTVCTKQLGPRSE